MQTALLPAVAGTWWADSGEARLELLVAYPQL
jgi:hypothetical protein